MSAAAADVPIEGKTVKLLTLLSAKRTYDLFSQDSAAQPGLDPERCVPCSTVLQRPCLLGMIAQPAVYLMQSTDQASLQD
jgi:hypothetical protein